MCDEAHKRIIAKIKRRVINQNLPSNHAAELKKPYPLNPRLRRYHFPIELIHQEVTHHFSKDGLFLMQWLRLDNGHRKLLVRALGSVGQGEKSLRKSKGTTIRDLKSGGGGELKG